eukprot:11782-Rhodomonas_salina.1
MSVSECALGLDETQLAHLIAKDKMARCGRWQYCSPFDSWFSRASRQAQLHEVDEAEQDPDLLALKKQEALAAAKNKEERKLNAILIANRELAKQNKQLSHSASPSPDHVTTPATQQKQQQQHVILSRSSSASKPHKQALDLPVNEATQVPCTSPSAYPAIARHAYPGHPPRIFPPCKAQLCAAPHRAVRTWVLKLAAPHPSPCANLLGTGALTLGMVLPGQPARRQGARASHCHRTPPWYP